MSFISSVVKFMRPYGDDDDLPGYTPPPEPDMTAPPRTPAQARSSYGGFEEARGGKVVNIHATAQLQVVLVHPESFDNVTEIAEHLRERRTVVLNLENTSKDVMRRLLDFLAGFAYAQSGSVKKIAVSTYIITPYNVSLMGDLIDELENNGLYF
ncbi:MAG: cell division protein SepF [Oscillospiraceae bacterium]|jgi:cell division inhibitor SepF|nr:cell division protein SepF [Oscillospiraceae bacterium]